MSAVEAASAPNGSMEESDRTSGIGTSLYIAPEVAISRSYNEKVSSGVVSSCLIGADA
jgi:translation initiation factor 2-alpha kinase 4